MKAQKTITLATCLLLGVPLLSGAQGPAPKTPERFIGHIIDSAGVVPGRTTTFFTLHVDRYSPKEEVERLAGLLKEKGQDAVIDTMQDMKQKGWLRIGGSLGYHVAMIRIFPAPGGGRVIRAVTDRPIQFIESMRGLRSRDYPFGIVELKLDSEGKGEGVLIAAASAEVTKEGALEVKSYGTQPFRILNVHPEEVK